MPKVSIIVPVYGVEKYLKTALDSLINQTLKDIEIILIDDGGKDNCPEIIDEYAKKDNRIIAIHKPNGGYGHSCNTGLDRATGEYIAIMEPDDFINPVMYEDLYKIAQENDSDIVKSSFYEFIDTNSCQTTQEVYWNKEYKIPSGPFTIKDVPMFLFFHPSVWTCIYKRDFLEKHNIRFVEAPGAGWTDNPFQVQTMCLAEKISYTPKAYYYWRILNINPSDELKDYKIPFIRCREMREWLSNNGYNTKKIMSAYYARELCYINITLGMKKIKNSKEYLNLLQEMLNSMDKETVINSQYICEPDKNLYKKLSKNIKLYYLKSRIRALKRTIKDLRKSIIRIRLNKKEKKITIFNNVIIDIKSKEEQNENI